jgi:hypothetical protein
MRMNLKKNNISPIRIEGRTWKQIKILQKDLEQILKIKRIRIIVELSINKGVTLKFYMAIANFKGMW